MQNKRFLLSLGWLISLHVLTLVFLSLFRLVEYLALSGMVADASASSLPAFVRGVWFDNVIVCYMSVLPVALTLLAATIGKTSHIIRRCVEWWYGILGCTALMVSAANIPYFAYFFKNINSSIFEWFGYAGTTAGMLVGEKSYIVYFVLYLASAASYVYLVHHISKLFHQSIRQVRESSPTPVASYIMRVIVLSLTTGLCIFGIRGRMGYNPIKISQAYYCGDSFLNQLGINPAFNLLTSALDDMRKENRDLHLMPYPQAIALARQNLGITGTCDSTHVLHRKIDNSSPLKSPFCQPIKNDGKHRNVVVILMESMSANFLETFGNRQHLTPTLDSLYNHSLAFLNCYSAGIHTNHGMTASLYSFPALMFRNLMKGTVTPHREGLPTVLKSEGYNTMFFMTHEAQYDNMKAFFSTNGYNDIYSQEDYPKSEVVNSFGVSDHFLFGYALDKINRQAATHRPFFATLLTISNHPPYVVPTWFKPKSKEPETQIVEYADYCIGDFLKKASAEPWYKNTIFVIMADHGKIVGKVKGDLPQSYNHIPLIIFGPGINNMQTDKLATQVDVMPTLLSILGTSYVYDGFGTDLTRTDRNMVFYSADNQIVARTKERCFIYEPKTKRSLYYVVKPGWELQATQQAEEYKPLRQYVFSMIQTAQYMLKKQ